MTEVTVRIGSDRVIPAALSMASPMCRCGTCGGHPAPGHMDAGGGGGGHSVTKRPGGIFLPAFKVDEAAA
jgi:hypothetical protein